VHGRIRGFDGIRALAAGAVVSIHLHFKPFDGRFEGLVQPVTAFFLLSGYLITTKLLIERDATGTISLRRFWQNRVVRILPVYVVFLAAIRLGMENNWLWPTTIEHWNYAATYRSNFVPTQYRSVHLWATWSLAIEEHFYLVWPLVMGALYRWRVLLTGAVLALCAGVRLWLYTHPQHFGAYAPLEWTIPAADPILAGALLAFWHRRRGPRPCGGARSHVVALGGIALLAVMLHRTESPTVAVTQWYLLLAGIAVLLGWIVDNQQSLVVRALEVAPLRFLGTISYGIYVWQAFVIGVRPEWTRYWWQRMPFALFVIVGLATLSWYAVERPFLRLKARSRTPAAEEELEPVLV
jgi:peptidoglycan/LPS O-acetylase OafA/YrhL